MIVRWATRGAVSPQGLHSRSFPRVGSVRFVESAKSRFTFLRRRLRRLRLMEYVNSRIRRMMESSDTMEQVVVKMAPLPYEYTALAPAISQSTMKLHFDKHYAGYVATLNRLVEGTQLEGVPLEEVIMITKEGAIFNNAAQVWNHEFYFVQLSPEPKSVPTGKLMEAIEHSFGSFEEFKARMLEAAMSLFGSGWVWLVVDDEDQLHIHKESNAGTPIVKGMRPLLTIDVWEHAYYCDYQNRRADAVTALWSVIDWYVVELRYLY